MNFKINLFVMATLTCVILTQAKVVFAGSSGGVGGGGGVVFDCRGGDHPSIKTGKHKKHESHDSVYLADIFQLLHGDPSGVAAVLNEKYGKIDSEKVIENAIIGTISIYQPDLAQRLIQNLHTLQFVPGGALPPLGDDDITTPPPQCQKRQLGIQTFATNTVQYDSELYSHLSSAMEQALFHLHEAYVNIYKSNSFTVRHSVAGMAQSEPFVDFLSTTMPDEFATLNDRFDNEGTLPSPSDLVGGFAGICYPSPGLRKIGNGPTAVFIEGIRTDNGVLAALVSNSAHNLSNLYDPSVYEEEKKELLDLLEKPEVGRNQAFPMVALNGSLVTAVLDTQGTGKDRTVHVHQAFRLVDGRLISEVTAVDHLPKPYLGRQFLCYWFQKMD